MDGKLGIASVIPPFLFLSYHLDLLEVCLSVPDEHVCIAYRFLLLGKGQLRIAFDSLRVRNKGDCSIIEFRLSPWQLFYYGVKHQSIVEEM